MKREKLAQGPISLARFVILAAVGVSIVLISNRSLAAIDSTSCSTRSENRQLDFWLGDWSVTHAGMPGTAVSNVSLDLDHCVVVESWDDGKGHAGKNLFAYSADDKRWHGMFADNRGRVHIFQGRVNEGSAEFSGPSRGPDRQTVFNRIKIVRMGRNKAEQSWEKSKDNGATWILEFRGEYSRKNP